MEVVDWIEKHSDSAATQESSRGSRNIPTHAPLSPQYAWSEGSTATRVNRRNSNRPSSTQTSKTSKLAPSMAAVPAILEVGRNLCSQAEKGGGNMKACTQLGLMVHNLMEVIEQFQEMEPPSNDEGVRHILDELENQMRQAKDLVDRASEMPHTYRMLNAFHIHMEFKELCFTLGRTVEGLHSAVFQSGMLTTRSTGSSMARGMDESFKHLEWDFRKSEFPLQEQEKNIYRSARKLTTDMYRGQLNPNDGVKLLRDVLVKIIGEERMKSEWKQVADHLFHDMYSARVERDRIKEHHIRQLFQAVTGVDKAPPEFYCPLSKELMEDPVVLVESGVMYDKRSLESWLFAYGSNKCKVSGRSLLEKNFVECKALGSLIGDWKRRHKFDKPSNDVTGSNESATSSIEDNYTSLFGTELDHHDISCTVTRTNTPSQPWRTRDDPFEVREGEDGQWVAHRISSIVASRVTPRNHPRVFEGQSTNLSETGVESVAENSPVADVPTRTRKRVPYKDILKEMQAAASIGDLDSLEEMSAEGWKMDHWEEGGPTCLHLASAFGHLPVVQFLLGLGIDVNIATKKDHATPLYMAACNGHVDVLKILLEHGGNLMIPNSNGWTPLHVAADSGQAEMVDFLLRRVEQERLLTYPIQTTKFGWTVLHHAARSGNVRIVDKLLPFFHDFYNQTCTNGYTALHVAVDNDHIGVTEKLLRQGADPNIAPQGGWAPLHLAVTKNNVEIGKLLLRHGANPNLRGGQDGLTSLHLAASMNHVEFAKLLVAEGKADVSLKSMPNGEPGRKAIEIASDLNHNEIHAFLFKRAPFGLKGFFNKQS